MNKVIRHETIVSILEKARFEKINMLSHPCRQSETEIDILNE